MKKYLWQLLILSVFIISCSRHKPIVLLSPNQQVSVVIFKNDQSGYSSWSYSVFLEGKVKKIEVVETSSLGLKRNDGDFFKNLELVNVSEVSTIDESYTMIAGKRKINRNHANQFTLSFRNTNKQPLDILFRAYDTGVAFRYIFPDESSE
ncbi:MAG: glycoside hydrolase family 97 N-terminal domain-containing protein, partial [bacterium]